MEFIVLIENNHKENEMLIFYCQWTHNEEELEKLIYAIENVEDNKLSGDYSDFQISHTKISESAVDEHVKLTKFGSYTNMFTKCVGSFKCPNFSRLDKYELASSLDNHLYHGGILKHFTV